MAGLRKSLEIGSSPHITSGASVDVIMRNVVYALLPVCAFSIYAFGLAALLVLATALASCLATEYLVCRATGTQTTTGDWSVTITGLLYGLTLPPALPLWMVAVGGVFAVAIGKALFGGLGYNAFNPALVGRAFLQAAFPQAMTHWTLPFADSRFSIIPTSVSAFPFAEPVYDAVTAATPLARMKFESIQAANPDLLWGMTAGSAGETSFVLILLGGAYLAARNMLNWRIPVSVMLTAALLSWAFMQFDPVAYPKPAFTLFAGGLALGAVFMATDMVASPITNAGCWIYGTLIAVLIVVIRFWGGMPEGVMYAILLANAVSPHIDNLIQPRVFGTGRGSG